MSKFSVFTFGALESVRRATKSSSSKYWYGRNLRDHIGVEIEIGAYEATLNIAIPWLLISYLLYSILLFGALLPTWSHLYQCHSATF